MALRHYNKESRVSVLAFVVTEDIFTQWCTYLSVHLGPILGSFGNVTHYYRVVVQFHASFLYTLVCKIICTRNFLFCFVLGFFSIFISLIFLWYQHSHSSKEKCFLDAWNEGFLVFLKIRSCEMIIIHYPMIILYH